MQLQRAKNQVAEVLYELLTKKKINRRDVMNETGILNLSARIGDLRIKHNLTVKLEQVKTKNKHGRRVVYGNWLIPDDEKEKALEVYNNINR